MQIETVRKYLEHYRDYKGKIAFLENQISYLIDKLNDVEFLKEKEKEAIESKAITINRFDDTPKSITNEFFSKTETAALKYHDDEELKDLQEAKENMIAQIQYYRNSVKDLKHRSELVRAWLANGEEQILPEKQLFILRLSYIKGLSIADIKWEYHSKYEVRHKSTEFKKLSLAEDKLLERTVYRIKKEALNNIVCFTK
jgi:hypothetical protein